MIHPLFRLIATKPQLVGDHVQAYAELIGAEFEKTSQAWAYRAVYGVAAAFLWVIGVVFVGVALMLWAVTPYENMLAPWLLITVPLVPLGGGLFCFLKARASPAKDAFETVKEQLNADLAMLREVGAAS